MSQSPDFLEDRPFSGNKRLFNLAQVEFRLSFIKQDVDTQHLHVRPGDEIIVETGRGPAIARVTSHIARRVAAEDTVMQAIRKATEADIEQALRNEVMEYECYHFCVQRVQERDIPMKVVRAHVMQDSSRIIIYFSSDGRVDFRELVKDLAHRFRTRIEMHQIGVRDGTRMIGGIGPCGRELCCSTFLENFAPVSIRMAKDQGLTLNPAKVSGMCGRLMCCLVYEQAVYRRMKKGLPRAGKPVLTPDGPGKVLEVDVINQRVMVQLEDTNRRTYAAQDVSQNVSAEPIAVAKPEYVWDEALSDTSADTVVKNRRRRDRPAQEPKTPNQEPKVPNQEPKAAKTEGEPAARRRRRKPQTGAPAKATEGAPSTPRPASKSAPQNASPADSPAGDGAAKKKRRRRRKPGNSGSSESSD